jgi:hypothetical protein
VAENRCKHSSCCGHAIPTDGMSVELKCELDVAVAKQSLHGFWISSGADEKRREAVTQIMKAEPSWVIIDQLSPGIPGVRRECRPSLQLAADDLGQACWRHAAVYLLVGMKETPSHRVANMVFSASREA